MSRFFCCVTGETSNSAPPEEVFDDEPLVDTESLNRLWRDELQIPDPRSRGVEEPDATLFPVTPPLPANCGRPYRWHEILHSTVNFRQEFYLGKGNFGEVYRVNFERTNEVGAVKIQAHNNETGHKEFLAEVTTLHEANHPNVIKLLGRCYGRRNRAIVYEFMPNGTLGRHIFDYMRKSPIPQGLEQPTRVLDWGTRMRIAEGVSEGLIYLHEVLKVINQDVKAGNILLDANFVPKLTDFGLATKVVVNRRGVEKRSKITELKGTMGYIPPEAEQSHWVSTKYDVYSYGVFLIVLFTGRRPYNQNPNETVPEDKRKLTDWFLRVWARYGDVPEAADTALGNTYSVEGLKRIFQTARLCISAEPQARPPMRDVVTMVRQAAVFPVRVVPLVERGHTI
ncbi:PREDICTED: serine/threonine-protein kinase CDL1-like [Camelina sativa]|uniref:Serine/threonine-protein kinase CDL1-like n=1 Tax=Camelina sativa TaxID=90675 RepID=A0ABM0UTQ9_CAMSA|nr:PREDICTED: serine/threonine-protein kinase CDL1-like [Camelina sativa]